MKGHALPGINQRGYKSKINEGKPGAPKTIDPNKDEMSDEEKKRRLDAASKMGKWNKANPNATQAEMNAEQTRIWNESRKNKEKNKEKNKKPGAPNYKKGYYGE